MGAICNVTNNIIAYKKQFWWIKKHKIQTGLENISSQEALPAGTQFYVEEKEI